VDKKTRVEDRTSANVEMFGVKDIAIGDYVEVRGHETAPLQIDASRLERRPSRNDVWVRGQVRDVAAPNFTALGLTIVTSVNTVFDGMTSTQFFASAAGHIVKVKGTMVNNQLVANEVEFEDHEDDGDHKGGDDHGGHGGGPGGGGGGPG
jgi:hypothetical protein